MGVMEMGNVVPRAGKEPTSWPVGSLMSPLYPYPPVDAAPYLRGQNRLLHSSPWNCKPFNAYNYIHIGNGFIFTYTE